MKKILNALPYVVCVVAFLGMFAAISIVCQWATDNTLTRAEQTRFIVLRGGSYRLVPLDHVNRAPVLTGARNDSNPNGWITPKFQ